MFILGIIFVLGSAAFCPCFFKKAPLVALADNSNLGL
jgi:hypothetical protein